MSRVDPGRLHVITDETLQNVFRHEQLAAAAASGGADVVQYREKRDLPFEERLETARRVVASSGSARCVVNDDAELARRAQAWGVHLGVDDLPPGRVRRSWPGVGCIGATANDLTRARKVDVAEVDYLGVGPVFGTRSKARPAPPLGLDRLREIVASVDKPVIAIGNIDSSNVESVMRVGVWGVAVLSSVVGSTDPAAATRRLRRVIDRCLSERVAS